jgi:hypothetical protein
MSSHLKEVMQCNDRLNIFVKDEEVDLIWNMIL